MSPTSALPVLPSKADQVYEVLRDRILSGVYKPEARLSMDALAKELGVSKIPVREAIGRLESQGLVVSQLHAGPTVSPVSLFQLEGVYLARQELEPVIASVAAGMISPAQVDTLRATQVAMRAALKGSKLEDLGELNYRFHMTIAEATNYDIFAEFTERLLLAVRRHRVAEPLDADNWNTVIAEHDHIVDCLARGDGDAAAAASRQHAFSQARHDAVTLDPGQRAHTSEGEL